MNPQRHYPAIRLWFQGKNHDLPQLPDSMQAFRKAQERLQRFRCNQCTKTFTEEHEQPLDTMRLPLDRAVGILQLLLEGMSVRSVERVTGVHRDTILRLLVLAGERCQNLMDEKLKGITVADVEVDEIWGYVGKKEGHKSDDDGPELGDAYCFIGMERTTKLILAHHLGKRTAKSTDAFIGKLAYATSTQRYQLTSDGFSPYVSAVKMLLRDRVDFAQLINVYGSVPVEIMGRPVADRICTSYIERQNLSIRMGMRRMTRLSNAFSKKWENLQAAYSLWFAYYNFCRKHHTLRVTPAMEAGIADHIWQLSELLF
jgi:transposase-like protein/IS1 family transposase